MRELLAVFAGNEMVVGVCLGSWFVLTGVGTWLGRIGNRLRHPAAALVWVQMSIAVLPPVQVIGLRLLRNVVFLPGAAVGVTETVSASLVLLAPYCLASGSMLTLACAVLARQASAVPAGRVYVADSVGSIAGGVLFSGLLVHLLDHVALLWVPGLLNLGLAGLTAWHVGLRWMVGPVTAAALAIAAAVVSTDLDAISTARQFAGQQVVFRGNSPYGRLVVTKKAGALTFFENGQPTFATGNIEAREETVHYAMAQRPQAKHVLLVSGGFSGTAQEILRYPVRELTYVELDPLVLAAGRRFLPEALAEPRIRVVQDDGRRFIATTPDRFDVVIVDVADPATSQLNRFYTAEFFRQVKRVLAPDGVVCFGLGQYANYVSPQLARLLASAYRTVRSQFAQVLMIPGGRVFFLASDGPLYTNVAERLEAQGITTRLVNRHYLAATLRPDRVADLQRAVAQPAARNTDFSPVLYYYHLRHWLSQFDVRIGVGLAALGLGLVWYLIRLRPVALVVLASGFAASGLEVVLLLAFQILCGALYQQVGLLVTAFMVGLAVGAAWMTRSLAQQQTQSLGPTEPSRTALGWLGRCWGKVVNPAKQLACLAWAVAGFAGLLPVALPMVSNLTEALGSSYAAQVFIVLLTLGLATLVGLQFPLANRVGAGDVTTTASRLYTADLVGASLGALLPSTLLIPLWGLGSVCLLAAGLNAFSGWLVWRRT
jgi:spermidine synthase